MANTHKMTSRSFLLTFHFFINPLSMALVVKVKVGQTSVYPFFKPRQRETILVIFTLPGLNE
jgi:hypothetical protein